MWKSSIAGDALLSSEDIPLEIWMLIMAKLFGSLSTRDYIRLRLVNQSWRKMVNEAVTVVNQHFSTTLTDDILRPFAPHLQVLEFYFFYRSPSVSDSVVRLATNLTRLDIAYYKGISDDGISVLTKLTSLAVSCPITDRGVKNMTNLQSLALCANLGVSDAMVMTFTKLTELDCSNSSLSPSVLTVLTNLARLSLRHCNNNYDGAMRHLGTQLNWLYLENSSDGGVRDDGLKCLLGLTYLDLSGDRFISDVGVQNLSNLRTLILSAARNGVSNNGIRHLVNITSLDIYNNLSISDSGISVLTNLTDLMMDYAENVSDAGLSNLVNLARLALSTNVTDAGITNLTNLTKLKCRGNELLTNAGLVGLTKLKSLDLGKNKNVGDDGLKGLSNLKKLVLGYGNVTFEQGLKNLSKLEFLYRAEYLDLEEVEYWKAFRELPYLRKMRNKKSTACREDNLYEPV